MDMVLEALENWIEDDVYKVLVEEGSGVGAVWSVNKITGDGKEEITKCLQCLAQFHQQWQLYIGPWNGSIQDEGPFVMITSKLKMCFVIATNHFFQLLYMFIFSLHSCKGQHEASIVSHFKV